MASHQSDSGIDDYASYYLSGLCKFYSFALKFRPLASGLTVLLFTSLALMNLLLSNLSHQNFLLFLMEKLMLGFTLYWMVCEQLSEAGQANQLIKSGN